MKRLAIAAAAVLLAMSGCAPAEPAPASDNAPTYYVVQNTQKPTVTASAAAAAPPSITASATASAPATDTVAFIGDSYSAGTGAAKGSGFADLVAAKYKLKMSNFAQGGTGYIKRRASRGTGACGKDVCPNYNEMAPKVIKNAPAIVIVSGGRNDPTNVAAFTEAANQLFKTLRAGLPQARIIATSPVWGVADMPPAAAQMQDAVKAAVTSVGGIYVDLGEPLAGHPELTTGDKIHPNTAGHRVLAGAVIAGLTAAKVKLG